MLVLNPALSREEDAQARNEVRETITASGGSIASEDEWGTRRLAYSIKSAGQTYMEGVYYLFRFDLEPNAVPEIQRPLRLSEQVLRHMVTRTVGVKKPPAEEPQAQEAGPTQSDETQKPNPAGSAG